MAALYCRPPTIPSAIPPGASHPKATTLPSGPRPKPGRPNRWSSSDGIASRRTSVTSHPPVAHLDVDPQRGARREGVDVGPPVRSQGPKHQLVAVPHHPEAPARLLVDAGRAERHRV